MHSTAIIIVRSRYITTVIPSAVVTTMFAVRIPMGTSAVEESALDLHRWVPRRLQQKCCTCNAKMYERIQKQLVIFTCLCFSAFTDNNSQCTQYRLVACIRRGLQISATSSRERRNGVFIDCNIQNWDSNSANGCDIY
ncbi:hypothetical protein ScPMuIL_017551 [Solemya velum]